MHRSMITVAGLAMCAGVGLATPQTFFGIDAGASQGDALPNARAAESSFAAAAAVLPPLQLIDWESEAITDNTFLTPAPGVDVTIANVDGTFNTVDTVVSPIDADATAIEGFNTTAGGENFLRVAPAFVDLDTTVTFDFAMPIAAWGAFFTGVQEFDGDLMITFTNGDTDTFTPDADPTGGALFFGIVEEGRMIDRVDIVLPNEVLSQDVFGIDDVAFALPTPGAASLLGLAGLAAARRRR